MEADADSDFPVLVRAVAATVENSVMTTVTMSPTSRARRSAKNDAGAGESAAKLAAAPIITAPAMAAFARKCRSDLFTNGYLPQATHQSPKRICGAQSPH